MSDERQPTMDELRERTRFERITAKCTEQGGCVCEATGAPTCYRMIGYIQSAFRKHVAGSRTPAPPDINPEATPHG